MSATSRSRPGRSSACTEMGPRNRQRSRCPTAFDEAVGLDLGVVAAIDVSTRARTSLELVDTSYAANLSQLTWGRTAQP